MTPSLVLDLQRLAFDRSEKTSHIGGASYLVAKRLNVTEFASWAEKETYGYNENDEVPIYRIMFCVPILYEVNPEQLSMDHLEWRWVPSLDMPDNLLATTIVFAVRYRVHDLERFAASAAPIDFSTTQFIERKTWFGFGKVNRQIGR